MEFDMLGFIRRKNKSAANHARSMNAAAVWPDDPRMPSPNRDVLASAQVVGQRVAGLAKNDPVVSSALETIVSMVVGIGTRLNTSDEVLDAEFNNGRFDPSRLLSLTALQQATIRSWVTTGEALALLTVIDGEFAVHLLNPEQLDRSRNEDLGDGNRIIAGVELDAFDRRVAYWLLPNAPDDPFIRIMQSQRFEAGDVIHVFEREYAGQVRGISPLTPILTSVNTASVATEAGLKKLQVSALFTAFLTSPDGSDIFGDARPSLEPGALVRLNPGEEISSAQGGDAGDLPAFLKLIYHQCAAAIGVTYEDMTGDLSGVNYSSYRAGALTARRKAETRRKVLLIDGFLFPVFNRWRAIEQLKGRNIEVPSPKWIEPTWPEIDREKEANADIALVQAGLKSRKEVIEGRGRDFTAVSAEIEADEFQPASAAASSNKSQQKETETP
ncbi:MAG: portal protein [Shinella sp.]|nr:MAG: portal protein [Shinella sp.]